MPRAPALVLIAAACASAPRPRGGTPIEAGEARRLLASRPSLALPGATLLHEVLVEGTGRPAMLVGRLHFADSRSLFLHAQTPFGMDLFAIRCEASNCAAELQPALADRVPGPELAREIGRVYLATCPVTAAVERDGAEWVVRCDAGGARLTERLDAERLIVTERAFREANGRSTVVRYTDHARFGGVWHPRRIALRSGSFRVEIVLVDYDGP
jgi:hypothetical protein